MARTVGNIVSKAEEVMSALDPEQLCAVCGVRYSEMTCETIYMFHSDDPYIMCGHHEMTSLDAWSLGMHAQSLPDERSVTIGHLEWMYGRRCPPSIDRYDGWVTMREWRAACR